ncbi:hypothetical protein P9112_002574 [Eukaryota sp. TZLM1-RC]
MTLQSLSAFLDRCFQTATSGDARKQMQEKLKSLLDYHKANNTLTTHDWASEPIPHLEQPIKVHSPIMHRAPPPVPTPPKKKKRKAEPTPIVSHRSESISAARARVKERITKRRKSKSEVMYVVPKCKSICPPSETQQRIEDDMIDQLEWDNGVLRTIKQFKRSAAGVDVSPDDVRSPQALVDSFKRLLKIVGDNEDNLIEVFPFVSNRIRSIHQDLSFQNPIDGISVLIPLFESIIRLLILFDFKLIEFSHRDYDFHLNLDQISKLLTTLKFLYKLVSPNNSQLTINMPIFKTFSLFLTLNSPPFNFSCSSSLLGEAQIERICEWIRDEVDQSNLHHFKSLNIVSRYQNKDFYQFFKQFQDETMDLYCQILLQRPATYIQQMALQMINNLTKDPNSTKTFANTCLIRTNEIEAKMEILNDSSRRFPLQQFDIVKKRIIKPIVDYC